MLREIFFSFLFLTPGYALSCGEIFHLALQVNDYVSDVVLSASIFNEKSSWGERRQFIEDDLTSAESHTYVYTAPPVDGNETLVPLVGFHLENCNCSATRASGVRVVNAQESASWEVPLFLMQINSWETAECECPGSRYSLQSPEYLNNQYMYDSMTGEQKNKFCNPYSYHDSLFSESDLGVMFVFSVIIVVVATFTNALTVYTRLKVSFDITRQEKAAESEGWALNLQEQQSVMTTNMAITTVFIGLTEDTPQLILSCYFAVYKVADGGVECLKCVQEGTFCKLAIDPTADLLGMISSNPVAFYSVISSVITILYTASTIAYGVVGTPPESFDFMGVKLMDPATLSKYTYGCFEFSKKIQKVVVAVAFPVVYVFALLCPVNGVVYFDIRKMLHKDWTPSLVGFIVGLVAILFFFYWLVPAAAIYMYNTAFNNKLTQIKKVASGFDQSDVDAKKMQQAAPYLNDVDIDALTEMKGVTKDLLVAAKDIDVPTLRAIKSTGMDAASVQAAKGIDVSRLRAIGECKDDLDAAEIRDATAIKRMDVDLHKVRNKNFVQVIKASRGIDPERVKELENHKKREMDKMDDHADACARFNLDLTTIQKAFQLCEKDKRKYDEIPDAVQIWREYLRKYTGNQDNISRETLELVRQIGPHRLMYHENIYRPKYRGGR